MDACGATRRGKAKCDARLTKLFADIAPEDASSSRISSGKSGAESHAQRLDDVFGSLNHTLSGSAAQAAPSLAALEASAPAARPSAAPPRPPRPAKKPRRKANSPRRPPPKPGYTIETLGRPSSAAAERGAAMSFLRELRERKGGGKTPADADDANDAAPRFRKRPRRAGTAAAPPKLGTVSLSHLDDMDDGL